METRPKLLSRTEQSVTRFETNYFRHENLRCFSIARIINNNTQLARFRFSTKTKFPSSVYSPNFLSLPSVKSDRFAKIRCASRLSNRGKIIPQTSPTAQLFRQREREKGGESFPSRNELTAQRVEKRAREKEEGRKGNRIQWINHREKEEEKERRGKKKDEGRKGGKEIKRKRRKRENKRSPLNGVTVQQAHSLEPFHSSRFLIPPVDFVDRDRPPLSRTKTSKWKFIKSVAVAREGQEGGRKGGNDPPSLSLFLFHPDSPGFRPQATAHVLLQILVKKLKWIHEWSEGTHGVSAVAKCATTESRLLRHSCAPRSFA